jgi:hypothetical protein
VWVEESGVEYKDDLNLSLLNSLLVGIGVLGGGGTSTVASDLHENDGEDDNKPVDAVTGDGADGGDVHPAENRIEESPATVIGLVGVTVVEGPDVTARIVRTSIIGITSNNLAPLIHLVCVDSLSKETSGDQQKEAGRGNEEAVKSKTASSTVDNETDKGTSQQTNDNSKRNRLSFSIESNLNKKMLKVVLESGK